MRKTRLFGNTFIPRLSLGWQKFENIFLCETEDYDTAYDID